MNPQYIVKYVQDVCRQDWTPIPGSNKSRIEQLVNHPELKGRVCFVNSNKFKNLIGDLPRRVNTLVAESHSYAKKSFKHCMFYSKAFNVLGPLAQSCHCDRFHRPAWAIQALSVYPGYVNYYCAEYSVLVPREHHGLLLEYMACCMRLYLVCLLLDAALSSMGCSMDVRLSESLTKDWTWEKVSKNMDFTVCNVITAQYLECIKSLGKDAYHAGDPGHLTSKGMLYFFACNTMRLFMGSNRDPLFTHPTLDCLRFTYHILAPLKQIQDPPLWFVKWARIASLAMIASEDHAITCDCEDHSVYNERVWNRYANNLGRLTSDHVNNVRPNFLLHMGCCVKNEKGTLTLITGVDDEDAAGRFRPGVICESVMEYSQGMLSLIADAFEGKKLVGRIPEGVHTSAYSDGVLFHTDPGEFKVMMTDKEYNLDSSCVHSVFRYTAFSSATQAEPQEPHSISSKTSYTKQAEKNRAKRLKKKEKLKASARAESEPKAIPEEEHIFDKVTRLALEQNSECMVCMEDLNANNLVFLTCNSKSFEGPMHVMCKSCWDKLPHQRCPLCCQRVDGFEDPGGFVAYIELIGKV